MFGLKKERSRNVQGVRKNTQRTKESKLLMGKCSKTGKDFVIRIDRKITEPNWEVAYAFPFHPTMKGDSSISGRNEKLNIVRYAPDWNGCPFCGGKSTLFCRCGSIFCSNSDGIGRFTCPSCGFTDDYAPAKKFDVKSSAF